MKTTGNAGGSTTSSHSRRDDLTVCSTNGTGPGHELLGHGANMVTGDYTRGAAGFWVENGEIPVRSRRSHAVTSHEVKGHRRHGRYIERAAPSRSDRS